MKIYKLNICNDFECIGSACPETCCYGWKIIVDKKTGDMYRSVEGEFGDKLRKYVVDDPTGSSYMIKLLENGKCPFLDEKSLCEIYQHLGEEALCHTCTVFPRTGYGIITPNHEFLGYTLACPEVTRLFFDREDKITPIVSEEGRENPTASVVRKKFDNLMNALLVSISMIQNRNLHIADRLRLVVFFNDLVENDLKAGKNIDALIKDFLSEESQVVVANGLKTIPANQDKLTKYILTACNEFVNGKDIVDAFLGKIASEVLPAVNEATHNGDVFDVSKLLRQIDTEKADFMMERYLVYQVYYGYMRCFENFDIVNALKVPVYMYSLSACFWAMHEHIKGDALKHDEILPIFSHFSRFLEHSTLKGDNLVKIGDKVGIYGTSELLSIIM